jgi:hypothetical protein
MKCRAIMPTASRCSLGQSKLDPGAHFGLPGSRNAGAREEYVMALVVGLVSIALVWLIVIYGSIYLNKNVQ